MAPYCCESRSRRVSVPSTRSVRGGAGRRAQTGIVWFGSRAALSHSGSPGGVPEGDGTFLDDTHNVSEWREVLTGEEIPFEFEARGKLRHR